MEIPGRIVTIAGKEHELRYTIRSARDLAVRADKGVLDVMSSNSVVDHVLLIWAGLTHAKPKLTPDQVVDMLEAHRVAGGDYVQDILVPAVITAAITDKVSGATTVNEAAFLRNFGFVPDDMASPKAEGG